jgi:Protein of unknown function (DUF402)
LSQSQIRTAEIDAMTERWRAGDTVIVRTVHENGRVGMVLPTTVVQDRDDLVALYLAPETVCKRRVGKRGGPRGRLLIEDTGRHEDWTWDGNRRLILWRPHAMHAVSLFWRGADDTFLGWYVDILLPFRRSSLGFDTRDLDLDVVIDPDRAWRLKDEDELTLGSWITDGRSPPRGAGRARGGEPVRHLYERRGGNLSLAGRTPVRCSVSV